MASPPLDSSSPLVRLSGFLRAGLCGVAALLLAALALLTGTTVAGEVGADRRLALSLSVFLAGAAGLQLLAAGRTGRALLLLVLATPVVLVDLLWLASLVLGALLKNVRIG